MPLEKISYDDFSKYLIKGLYNKCKQAEALSSEILKLTNCHPYYTQQFAFSIWNNCNEGFTSEEQINRAIDSLIQIHDMDYERLWQTQNQTDKKILISLSQKEKNILTERFTRKYSINATSTVFSSLKRLMKQGYVIKTGSDYELDDPFFAEWIKRKREE